MQLLKVLPVLFCKSMPALTLKNKSIHQPKTNKQTSYLNNRKILIAAVFHFVAAKVTEKLKKTFSFSSRLNKNFVDAA